MSAAGGRDAACAVPEPEMRGDLDTGSKVTFPASEVIPAGSRWRFSSSYKYRASGCQLNSAARARGSHRRYTGDWQAHAVGQLQCVGSRDGQCNPRARRGAHGLTATFDVAV